MLNKTRSLKNSVYLVGLHMYYKMVHGPYNVKLFCSLQNLFLASFLFFFLTTELFCLTTSSTDVAKRIYVHDITLRNIAIFSTNYCYVFGLVPTVKSYYFPIQYQGTGFDNGQKVRSVRGR